VKAFSLNLLLALVWLALTGDLTRENFVLGFVLAYALLRVSQRVLPGTRYFDKFGAAARFSGFFVWELLKANLRVAYDIVTPRHHMRPGVVAIPLDVTTDAEIALLACLITLTPGTLCLDVSKDRRLMYVHAMYLDDVQAFKTEIKLGFEQRVLELMR
jgi:multicomponent Na+:H+ antiporter subunit E